MLRNTKNNSVFHTDIATVVTTCAVVVLACVMPLTTHAAVSAKSTLGTGLVGHWTFDESRGATAGDHSGNGNTGTLTNNPLWTTGRLGSGVQFDGVNDYVTVPSTASIKGQTAATISAWYKPAGFTTDGAIYYESTSATGYTRFAIYQEPSGAIMAAMRDTETGTPFLVNISNAVSVGTWYHFVLTVDTNTDVMILYKNGVEIGRNTSAKGAFTNTAPVETIRIGSYPTTPNYLNGSLDDVRIYNRALSATEVTALYQLGSTKIAAATQTGNDVLDGLVGYWGMDEGTGTTAADGSGSGNTGTLVNSPT